MPFRLDLVDGLRIVKSFPLEPEKAAKVGRSAQSAIRLNDDRVSRRHCVLTPKADACLLTDLGSHNGTKVNGHPISEHKLQDGDQIVVGNTMLIFRTVEQEVKAPKEKPEDTAEMTASMPVLGADGRDQSVVRAVLRHRDSRYLNAELLDAIPGDRASETLKALYRVASTVLSIRSINELLNQLLDLVFETLPVERATVLLSADGRLEARATKSRLAESPPRPEVSLTIAQRCYAENVAILSQDAMSDARFAEGQSIVMHGVRSAMCVPLSSGVKTWGVLYADRKTASSAFTEEQLDFLLAVSRQVGLALENLFLQDEHRKTFESLIQTLAASIDAKDPVTAGHSDRVARYSMALADRLGLPREQKRVLRLAAYLHDYGKIGIRDAVLLKPSELTTEEYQEIKEHPRYTGEILGKIHFAEALKDIPKIAMSHHERMDGRGYPNGLKGDEIPLGSRIIAIADVWDALTSARQYKKGWKIDQAMSEIESLKGAHLDAELVDLFLRYVQEEVVPEAEGGQAVVKKRMGPLESDEIPVQSVDPPASKPPALW